MKTILFFFLVVLSLSGFGGLITTSSMSLTVDDNDEPILNSIQVKVPTLFGSELDGDETGGVDTIVVTNPTTGSTGPDFVETVSTDLGNSDLDILNGITVLPEPGTFVFFVLGLLVMRMLPRRPPSW